jgi:hypothetical protein
MQMLHEEQIVDLLQRCEAIIGRSLQEIRGKLDKPDNRAAAAWELIVIDAISELGRLQYEPTGDGSPDLLLTPSGGRDLWVEIAYLYPRFWQAEQASILVRQWIFREAGARGISPSCLELRLDGKSSAAGSPRKLPHAHEERSFRSHLELTSFFDAVTSDPSGARELRMTEYSVQIVYVPGGSAPYRRMGGRVQESPKTVKEHAVYRSLSKKAQQHSVEGPHVVCLGGYQHSALSDFGYGTSVRDAVAAAFRRSSRLSGAIVVNIQAESRLPEPLALRARSAVYFNESEDARHPLSPAEVSGFARVNFNRWKYSFFELNKSEPREVMRPRMTGALHAEVNPMATTIEVPVTLLVEALAGKTNLREAYALTNDAIDSAMMKAIDETWPVVACELLPPDAPQGKPARVRLTLAPRATVFHQAK